MSRWERTYSHPEELAIGDTLEVGGSSSHEVKRKSVKGGEVIVSDVFTKKGTEQKPKITKRRVVRGITSQGTLAYEGKFFFPRNPHYESAPRDFLRWLTRWTVEPFYTGKAKRVLRRHANASRPQGR